MRSKERLLTTAGMTVRALALNSANGYQDDVDSKHWHNEICFLSNQD